MQPPLEGALRLLTVVIIACLAAAPTRLSAQLAETPDDEPPTRTHLMQGLETEESALAAEAARGSLPEVTIALQEGAVDPTAYRLGPNDRLQLAIWGAAELYHQLLVPPAGAVFIPDVGLIQVAGLTLEEARARVRGAVLERFSNVHVDVVLTGLRRFKVHVVGAVPQPGAYPATAVTRASELVELAGGTLEGASQRRIIVRHPQGDELTVDLAAYQLTGSQARNPFVNDGVVIEVPRRTTRVLLSGAVVNPGIYEPHEGERLSDLLRAVGGLSPWAETTEVTISTFTSPTTSETRPFNYVAGTTGGDPVLSDGDAVFFRERTNWHRYGQAFVYGAVNAPGRYPIPLEGIRLSELIPRAGGFTSRANLAQGHIRRPAERYTPINDPLVVERDTEDRYVRDELTMATEVDTVLVRCDFERLFGNGDADADVLVRDGDIVQVPEDRAEVRILGLVRRPGAYPFVPGKGVGHYVDAAGGYDRDADKGRMRLAPFNGAPLRDAPDGPVASGAILHVPEKERRTTLENVRDFTTVIVQVASLVVLVDRLTQR